jgi:chromosome segregation ATPase
MSERIIVLTEQDVKEAPSKVIDLLANLARRVTELERENEEIKRELSVIHSKVGRAEKKTDLNFEKINEIEADIQMALADIVTLDERTQPLVSKKSPVKVVVEEIHQEFNGVFTETKIKAYVKGENFRLNGTFEFKDSVKNIDDAAEKVSEVFK